NQTFFVLLLPRSSVRASATLVPYTTLFRSEQVVPLCGGDRRDEFLPVVGKDLARPPQVEPADILLPAQENTPQYQAQHPLGVGLDRKSTRLNSSHVKISYAVFCLKKKKNNR